MTRDRLLSLLRYDPATGLFHWRISRGRVKAGAVAGTKVKGYIEIRIDGVRYLAHRLAFLYMTGELPEEVDHDNRVKHDNRWGNLVASDRSSNMNNTARAANARGVHLHKSGKWCAQIRRKGAPRYLGLFSERCEAEAAYQAAKRK